MNCRVRVGDSGFLDIFVNRAATAEERRFQFNGDSRSMGNVFPLNVVDLHTFFALCLSGGNDDAFPAIVENFRLVGFCVDFQLAVKCVAFADLRHNQHRFAGCQRAVHAGGGNADPLLTAGHFQFMKL